MVPILPNRPKAKENNVMPVKDNVKFFVSQHGQGRGPVLGVKVSFIQTKKVGFRSKGGSSKKIPLDPINLREDSTWKGGELHGMSGDIVKKRLSKGYPTNHTGELSTEALAKSMRSSTKKRRERFKGTGSRVSSAYQSQSAAITCTGTDISKGLACGPSGSQAPCDISGWDLGVLQQEFHAHDEEVGRDREALESWNSQDVDKAIKRIQMMILGMDWLVSCYGLVDCYAKLICFDIPREPPFVWKGAITMESMTASAILAKLEAITRQWEVINKRLDHMGVPREQVGCLDTRQNEDRSSCEFALVYELPTTSEGEQNDQLRIDDLDLLECLENPRCYCTCEDNFDCGPLVAHDGLYVCEDYSCEREGDMCLEMPSTSSLYVSYIGHISSRDFETSSKCMHENPLFEVDLWNTFLNPLFVHDIFNDDKEGLLNFEDDTLRESEMAERTPLDGDSFRPLFWNIFAKFPVITTKDVWLYLKCVPPWHVDVVYCANSNPHVIRMWCLVVFYLFLQGLDSRLNPFQEGEDDMSQTALIVFYDILGDQHIKAQFLVTSRTREHACRDHDGHLMEQCRVCKVAWTTKDLRTHNFWILNKEPLEC
ncbi:hypothetical protein BC332_19309 [Capsicum chinense]|nr:hypothetical protein BC332_19309 [Capsicum chinense]